MNRTITTGGRSATRALKRVIVVAAAAVAIGVAGKVVGQERTNESTTAATSTSTSPAPGQIPPLPPRLPEGVVPAFPGAWGGGMFTTGGRGGKVIAVTNLNDSGPGSFRAAVEATGPRIVVFRVAGIIQLGSNVDIDHPDVTIAGQSAPGDGVCLANHSLNINTRNVIVRHLRVRRGRPQGGQGSDNIGGNPIGQVIVDHCSASW